MATPVVVKALRTFDAELTSVAPRRTLPTWFRGDAAHRLHASGHNEDDTPGSKAEYSDADNIPEIRAGDYRLPLNASFSAEQLIQYLVRECRAGRITWIAYIIYNKRIWTAKNGFVTQVYSGSNPHDHHFHISVKPDTASENNTKPVGLAGYFKPREVAKVQFEVTLPVLKEGDDDAKLGGYNQIDRIQAICGAERDGAWGPKTTAAIAKRTNRTLAQCKVMDEGLWRLILGLEDPKS